MKIKLVDYKGWEKIVEENKNPKVIHYFYDNFSKPVKFYLDDIEKGVPIFRERKRKINIK